MNVKTLFTDEGKEIAWYCSNCGSIYANKEHAEECCKPLICSKCGKEISRDRNKRCFDAYYLNPTRCSECYSKDREKEVPTITEDEYLKLCKEDDSFGPVFINDYGYSDLYEAIESEIGDYENIEDVPTEMYLGQWQKMEKIDIEDILYNKVENINSENYEPSIEEVYEDVDELRNFMKEWNNKQNKYKYYTEINKKVRIKPETIKEYFHEG